MSGPPIKFDEARRKAFLEHLRDTGNISAACRLAGISSSTARNYREAYPSFAEAWDEAIEEGADNLEEEARRRAMHGVKREIYHQGVVVGEELVYSDSLMALLLKAHKPDKYRERSEVQQSGGLTLTVVSGVPQPGEDLC